MPKVLVGGVVSGLPAPLQRTSITAFSGGLGMLSWLVGPESAAGQLGSGSRGIQAAPSEGRGQ